MQQLVVKRPLATELDGMASKRDVSWRKDADGVVLIRNNRWYRDDDLEVPQPLLRRWFATLLQSRRQYMATQEAVPVVPQSPEERAAAVRQMWDWTTEVFSTLTPWQMRNGLALFQPAAGATAAEAVSLLPLLTQAIQSFPADSVSLSLLPTVRTTDHILFGAPLPTNGLKVMTLQSAPQNAP